MFFYTNKFLLFLGKTTKNAVANNQIDFNDLFSFIF